MSEITATIVTMNANMSKINSISNIAIKYNKKIYILLLRLFLLGDKIGNCKESRLEITDYCCYGFIIGKHCFLDRVCLL